MSYHYMGTRLGDLETQPDPLDSCAYAILAALFSLAEPKLLAHWVPEFRKRLQQRLGRALTFVSPFGGESGGRFHAEMQLLDFLIGKRILATRGYVGVSKPCCAHCAAALRSAGLRFWTRHGARGPDPRGDHEVAPTHVHFRNAGECAAYREALQRAGY